VFVLSNGIKLIIMDYCWS